MADPRFDDSAELGSAQATSIFDTIQPGYKAGRLGGSFDSERLSNEVAASEINREFYRATGRKLDNPYYKGLGNPLTAPLVNPLAMPEWSGYNPVAAWKAQLREAAKSDPSLAPLAERADNVEQRGRDISLDAVRRFQEVTAQTGPLGMLAGGIAYFGGNVTTVNDPTAIPQLFVGPAASATRLGTAARWALYGAVGAAAGEIPTQQNYERLGIPYGPQDFALAVGAGGVLSGALGLGGRFVFDERFGTRPAAKAREAAARAEERAPLQGALDAASKAFADRLRREMGADAADDVEAGVRAADSAARREEATRALKPDIVPDDENIRMVDEADAMLRDLGETPEPVNTVRADNAETVARDRVFDETPRPDGAEDRVRFRGMDRPVTFRRLDPANIGADPARFQYKRYAGPTGDTGTLAGVEAWDPVSSGKAIVWEAADGALYIADGHQRLALAKRTQAAGQDVALDAVVMREADGWTPEDVRHYAAKKNLAEGAGDPLDVASILREAPDLLDTSMPLERPLLRTGRALARLTDEAMGAVRNGLITPEQGAVIARVAAEHPEMQFPLVQMFAKDPPRTLREAEFMAAEAMALPAFREQSAQMGLFGDAPLISGARERASILASAMDVLRADKRAFNSALRFADDLEAAGNVLAREENARREQAADMLLSEIQSLATRAGPVADALREITTQAIEEKVSAKQAGRRFALRAMDMLEERGLLALKTGAPEPRPAPEVLRPVHEQIVEEAEALEIGAAQDMDDDALRGALAEVAVERAMRGEVPPEIADDALGITPEADLARIDAVMDAMEALGEPTDPTVREAAAQWLAAADEDMEFEARMRLEPKPPEAVKEPAKDTAIDPAALRANMERARGQLTGDIARDAMVQSAAPFDFNGAGGLGQRAPNAFGDKPLTFTAAREGGEKVDPPFHPLDFATEAELRAAIDKATLPELGVAARDFGVDDAGSRTEIAARLVDGWREAKDVRFAKGDAVEAARASGYGGNDTGEAEEWLRAKAKGLDMSTEARMARAREMGFDTDAVWYRGSKKDYAAFDMSKVGSGFGGGDWTYNGRPAAEVKKEALDIVFKALRRHGYSKSEATEKFIARTDAIERDLREGKPVRLAGASAEDVKALTALFSNPAYGETAIFADKSPSVAAAYITSNGRPSGNAVQGGNIKPILARGRFAVVDMEGGAYNRGAQVHLQGAKELGYDGVIFKNIRDQGSLRTPSTQIAVFDPRNIRSVHAAFDPDRAGEANLLAARGEPAGGASAAAITASLESRFGKTFIRDVQKKGPLRIVQSEADLPLGDPRFTRFAMDARRADVPAMLKAGTMVRRMVNAAGNAVRKYANAETIRHEVTLPTGEKMSVIFDWFNGPDGTVDVTMDINKRMTSRVMEQKGADAVKADGRKAAVAFGYTLALIDEDIRQRGGTATYSFAGGDTDLSGFYSRLLSMERVLPKGYKAYVDEMSGMFYVIPEGVSPSKYSVKMLPIERERFAQDSRRIMGATKDGVAYLVADNLTPQNASAYFLHEMGVHVGLENMLGAAAFRDILNHVESRIRSDDPEWMTVRAMIPDDTPAHLRNEEALAYAVQTYEMHAPGSRIRGFVDRVLTSIKLWVWRTFPKMRDSMTLTMRDLRNLAEGAAYHTRRMEGMDTRPLRFAMERRNDPFYDARLTESENKAVEMRRNGYSNAEIADEMDTSADAVKVFISRAKAKAPDIDVPLGTQTFVGLRDVIREQLLRGGRTAEQITRHVNAWLDVQNRPNTNIKSVRVQISQMLAKEPTLPRPVPMPREGGGRRPRTAPEIDTALRDAEDLERIADMLKDCGPQ